MANYLITLHYSALLFQYKLSHSFNWIVLDIQTKKGPNYLISGIKMTGNNGKHILQNNNSGLGKTCISLYIHTVWSVF